MSLYSAGVEHLDEGLGRHDYSSSLIGLTIDVCKPLKVGVLNGDIRAVSLRYLVQSWCP
jgi:hypothetical protein